MNTLEELNAFNDGISLASQVITKAILDGEYPDSDNAALNDAFEAVKIYRATGVDYLNSKDKLHAQIRQLREEVDDYKEAARVASEAEFEAGTGGYGHTNLDNRQAQTKQEAE